MAPGDRVRAGQVLIVLDGRDLAAHARSARAAALAADQGVTAAASEQQAADAALALARATHERIAGLHAKRSATAQELDDATGALRAAEARAAGAAARAQGRRVGRGQRARRQRGGRHDRVVRAHHGAVRRRGHREDGRARQHGGTRHAADARWRTRAASGSRSAWTNRGSDRLHPAPSCPSRSTRARVARRRTSAARWRKSAAPWTPTRARFWSRSRCPRPPGCARGCSAGRTSAARPRRALTVPAGALVHRGQMTSVFVVEKGIARVRLVNVSGTEVLAGLSEGDVVIVGGASRG